MLSYGHRTNIVNPVHSHTDVCSLYLERKVQDNKYLVRINSDQ